MKKVLLSVFSYNKTEKKKSLKGREIKKSIAFSLPRAIE